MYTGGILRVPVFREQGIKEFSYMRLWLRLRRFVDTTFERFQNNTKFNEISCRSSAFKMEFVWRRQKVFL